MFVSKSALELFNIGRSHVDDLRTQVATAQAENRQLKDELAAIKSNNEWFRVRVNALELERAQLIKKAYNIDIPIPEIVTSQKPTFQVDQSLFEDLGDDEAKKQGMPIYGH